jgi:hypothetical protein
MAYKPWRIFLSMPCSLHSLFACQQHHRPSNSETLGKRLRPLAWPKKRHEIIVSSLPEGQDEYSDALQTQWRASSSSILPRLFLHKAVNNRSENLTPQSATHLAKGPPPTYRSSTETKKPSYSPPQFETSAIISIGDDKHGKNLPQEGTEQ